MKRFAMLSLVSFLCVILFGCNLFAQAPVAPPVCSCNGVGVCQCGLNCKCAKGITPTELWDRCTKGETVLVQIGGGPTPEGTLKLSGKLQGKRVGNYGDGVYRCEPDGKGGVQIVSVSRFVSSSCPGGVCPNQR